MPSASTTLEAFITSPLTPPPASLISFLTRILLLSDEEASRDKVVRVLAVLKERFAGVWERESLDVLGKVDGEIEVGIISLCDAVAKVRFLPFGLSLFARETDLLTCPSFFLISGIRSTPEATSPTFS